MMQSDIFFPFVGGVFRLTKERKEERKKERKKEKYT